MDAVPSLVAFGALAPWPNSHWQGRLKAILKQDRTLEPVVAALLELPSLWEVLRNNDGELDSSTGKDAADGLARWLSEDIKEHLLQENRNAVTMPITVASHVVQYLDFLQQTDSDIDHALLLKHVANRGGIQGLCAGVLSALAIASASHQSDIGRYAASSIRLAFCVGVYVDLDQERCTQFTNIAVRWPREILRSTVDRVLAVYPDTYTGVLRDERDATVTCPKSVLKQVREALAQAGVSTRDTGLLGRYHCGAHRGIPERILEACGAQINPVFTNVSLVLSNTDWTPFQESNALVIALRGLLENQANWHATMSKATASITAADSKSYILGIGVDAVPRSAAKRAFTRKIAANTLDSPAAIPPRTHRASLSHRTSIDDHDSKHAIAVIGMACKFPGANSVNEFWDLLLAGKSMLSKMPAERFKAGSSSRSNDEVKFWGNFIDDIDAWDSKFFKKSAREALSTDPQQRHLLQVTYHALQDSGYFSDISQPRDIGTYIGACSSDYDFNVASHPPTAYSTVGTLRAFLSGKISHYFGWSGPSLTFDTACSSSAVAIHTACRALQNGECSQAVAGGATLFSSPYLYENLAAAHFLSPTGATKPFDACADGYCRGEGIGVVVLKRMDDAIADGDAIRGLILGSAVNQNSNCVPITVPHSKSQASLYRKVAKEAAIDPHSIDFVEAHGTGTPVGDPIEMESIREAFASATHRSSPLFVSSVKGAIGHLEGASGVAALIKAVLQLEHREVVPQASFASLNPRIPPLEPNRIFIPTSLQKLDRKRLTACVNNYGAAGSNATLVLMEAPGHPSQSRCSAMMEKYPIMLSAASAGSLVAYCKALDGFLSSWCVSHTTTELSRLVPNLAYSLSRHQDRSHSHNLAFKTSSTDITELQTQLRSQTLENNTITEVRQEPPLVLCFGGQGADSIALDRRVWESSTILRHHLDQCHELLVEMGYPGIYPYIFQTEPVTDIIAHNSMLFAMQYASAQSWIEAGLRIACLVGHSLGQLTALSVSGILTLRDGLKFVAGRAALMVQRWGAEPGSMVVLDADEEKSSHITSALSERDPQNQYEIACYNGPKCHVVVGDRSSATALIDEAKKNGIRHKALDVKYGFHSRFTDDLYPELEELAASLEIHEPRIALETCTKDSSWDAPTFKLIAAHTRDPVYFKQAIQRVSERLGSCTWLEAGSNSTVIGLAARIVDVSSEAPNKFLPVALNKPNSPEDLAGITVDLFKRGHKLQFWNFHRSQRADFDVLRLPPYAFEKHRHWLELVIPAPEGCSLQRKEQSSSPELPATLISLIKSDWQGHHFAISAQSPEFAAMAKGHKFLGTYSCPPSIYVDLAARAAQLVKRDRQERVLPQITGLQIGPSMSLDAKDNIRLLLQPFGADWKFSLKSTLPDSKYVEHASGIVGLQTKNASLEADFERFERLANRNLVTAVFQEAEDSLSGSMVYKVLSSLVDYAEHYRGVRGVCARGQQIAGKVVLPKELANHLYDGSIINSTFFNYFTQVAGIYANVMRNQPEGHVAKLSSVDVVRTGPSYQPLRADSFFGAAYEVLVYTSPDVEQVANDIFVYEAATGRMALYILGAVFKSQQLAPGATPPQAVAPLEQPDITIAMPLGPGKPLQAETCAAASDSTVARKQTSISDHASRDPKELIHEQVRRILEDLADIRPADVVGTATFESLGIDSLMIMELVSELAKTFKLNLHLDDVVDLADMDALFAYLARRGCGSGNADNFEPDARRQSEISSTVLSPRSFRSMSYGSAATPLTPASEIAWQSDDLTSRLSELVCTHLELDAELRGPENLANLGFDSLVAIEITSDIKRKFSLVIDLEDLDERSTFADLVRLVTGKRMPCTPTTNDSSERKTTPAAPHVNPPQPGHAPGPSNKATAVTIFDNVRLSFDEYAAQTGFQGFWTQVHPLQSRLVVAYVIEALKELGCDLNILSAGQKLPTVEIETKHKHLMGRMEAILADAGLVEPRNNSHFRTATPMPTESAAALYTEMLARHHKHTSETKLLNITASNLAACLTGTADPLRLLFADPVNKEVLADVYDSAPMCQALTRLLADYLSQILSTSPSRTDSNEPFRICEVGAGTGATARHIVAFLEARGIDFEYHFTDISGALVSAAKRRFRNLPGFSRMTFSALDCNVLPAEELRGKFHAVIATNCIHATPHASRSATNVRQLLKTDGVFCLVEFTRSLYWFDLVYGLLEGWWLFDDGRTHALADEGFWDRSLRDAGFGHVSWTDGDTLESQTMRLICAFP